MAEVEIKEEGTEPVETDEAETAKSSEDDGASAPEVAEGGEVA